MYYVNKEVKAPHVTGPDESNAGTLNLRHIGIWSPGEGSLPCLGTNTGSQEPGRGFCGLLAFSGLLLGNLN